MMSTMELARHSPSGAHQGIPIHSSSSLAPPPDPMDVTPSSMGPPALSSPNGPRNGANAVEQESVTNGSSASAVGAAAAAQQPKVVQTAFIHKLYNMLEDQSIQHLISWSSTNESFVMSPSSEFSKVLSSYFKHTNISSFVRQLNMYGFHKVSDVFHTGQPDSPLWEFKHGNNNFKRGDLVGLREIKRRASRHTLIHRDSYSGAPKAAPPVPPVPGAEPMPDHMDGRMTMLEHQLYDMYSRLSRAEDTCSHLIGRCSALTDNLMNSHHWNHELTNYILAMVPDHESHIYKSASNMQREIARQSELLRALDDPQDFARPPPNIPFTNGSMEPAAPLSPRQILVDEQPQSRRPSLFNISAPAPRQPSFRAPMAAHLSISPRRYGSIGTNNSSPSSARPGQILAPPPPPPPAMQHPLANSNSASSPPANLLRRHTSADIRLAGWQGPPQPSHHHSPFQSGANSTHYPSSPRNGPTNQHLRDVLTSYEFPRGPPRPQDSRQLTPPPMSSDPVSNPDAGWQLPGAKYPFRGIDSSAPPTRRSSMASNVHSLLNHPAEVNERPDDGGENEERKRKRLQ